MINQYSIEQGQSKKIYFIIILSIVIAVSLIAFYVFIKLPGHETKEECGNGKCETGENCYDCSQDCKCGTNEYCSEVDKKCVSSICGNGKCEPFESSENCCDDCKCDIAGEFCNITTHKCEMPGLQISDERVKELIANYYKDQGKTVISMEVQGTIEWKGELGKEVSVNITNQEWLDVVLVTEKGEVIEIPIT